MQNSTVKVSTGSTNATTKALKGGSGNGSDVKMRGMSSDSGEKTKKKKRAVRRKDTIRRAKIAERAEKRVEASTKMSY